MEKIKELGIKLARAHSFNEATPVPHPRTTMAARGDSSGSTERPNRGLPMTYRPLFGRPSEPNAPVRFGIHHMIGHVRSISAMPGVIVQRAIGELH